MLNARFYIELMGFIKARQIIISKLYFSRSEILQGKQKWQRAIFNV